MKTIKNYSSIEKDILKYIEKNQGILLDKNDIDEINLISLGMDSLDVAELILAFEEKYNIDLEDQQVYRFKSVRNFINCIYEKVNK